MARVLMVDDDADGCEPVARALERMGHAVRCVPNGREALAALVAGGAVDLAILDLRMPGMDGLKLLEVVRSYLRWHRMPVVVLSAYVTDADEARARALGAAHVFRKTQYEMADLIEVVNDLTAGAAPP